MRFDTLEFLFVFLPIALAGFFFLCRWGRSAQLLWLIVASAVFYAYWSVAFLPLLAMSVFVNYALGVWLRTAVENYRSGRGIFIAGIVFNLALLGYFKYAGFFALNLEAISGVHIDMGQIILPLGISFVTFQQIAYLADVKANRLAKVGILEYVALVIFFPHFIAGPILSFREVLPQLRAKWFGKLDRKRVYSNLAVGVTFLSIGLVKKAIFADTAATYVDPVFDAVDAGQRVQILEAWGAVLGFAIQIYFDFSGYSDMAIGLARMLGVRLPENFFAPYQSHSVIEFWRRWHITLSQFLRDHVYVPLGGNRDGGGHQFINIMVTMLLGGLWHGAAWTFVAWGALHGLFLSICHFWSQIVDTRHWPGWKTVSWLLTLFAIVLLWVLFRAHSFESSVSIWKSMFGANGVALPTDIEYGLRPVAPVLKALGIRFTSYAYWFGYDQWICLCLLIAVCLFLPPSQILLRRNRPVVVRYHGDRVAPYRFGVNSETLRLAGLALCAAIIFAIWIPRRDNSTSTISALLAGLTIVASGVLAFARWDRLLWRPDPKGLGWIVLACVLGVMFVYRGRGNVFIYFQF